MPTPKELVKHWTMFYVRDNKIFSCLKDKKADCISHIKRVIEQSDSPVVVFPAKYENYLEASERIKTLLKNFAPQPEPKLIITS